MAAMPQVPYDADQRYDEPSGEPYETRTGRAQRAAPSSAIAQAAWVVLQAHAACMPIHDSAVAVPLRRS
jgi:hypothetical protein